MENNKSGFVLVLIALIAIGVYSSIFVIPEGRQAVITQFGKPVRVVKNAGMHFKLPVVQDVRMIDLRILNWDGYPNQIPTKDKKYIEVDTTARWQISDPLKFIQTVQSERGARSRLDAILDGITRDVISSHNLVEAVRNSNDILTVIENKENAAQKAKAETKGEERFLIEEDIAGEVDPIEIGREQLSELIVKRASTELAPLGVTLIDVQLKRISYEKSVQQKVYSRMISERQRIAEKIRSFGKGERAKIEGKTERDLKTIQSEAYRKVQKIKGDAEGQATAIYAKALNQDSSFYRFVRSLEAYQKSIPNNSKLILSVDSKFWKVLHEGK